MVAPVTVLIMRLIVCFAALGASIALFARGSIPARFRRGGVPDHERVPLTADEEDRFRDIAGRLG